MQAGLDCAFSSGEFPNLYSRSALREALPQTVPLDLMRWRYDRGEYLRSDVPACRRFPMPWSVQPANKQWQFFVHYAQHLYLYSAHYDGREDGGAGAVRVLGMIDRYHIISSKWHFSEQQQKWQENFSNNSSNGLETIAATASTETTIA